MHSDTANACTQVMQRDKEVGGGGAFPRYVNFGLRNVSGTEPLHMSETVCTSITAHKQWQPALPIANICQGQLQTLQSLSVFLIAENCVDCR